MAVPSQNAAGWQWGVGMSIKPIIMSGSMVRAVLRQIKNRDGKTQTRRVVTAGTTTWDGGAWPQEWHGHHIGDLAWVDKSFPDSPILKIETGDTIHRIRPRIEVGDRLYVRESIDLGHDEYVISQAIYKADSSPVDLSGDHGHSASNYKNKTMPSIHMPRAYSRITLDVKDVRFERIQDISETDAAAEGVAPCPMFWTAANPEYSVHGETNIYPWRIGAFTELWDNINRERGCGWDTNPWVVVIEFEPHLCNVDQMPEVAE